MALYVTMLVASMDGVVTYAKNSSHILMSDMPRPCVTDETCALEPDTGNEHASSAKQYPMINIKPAPTTHATSAAGPACFTASIGAYNQPEPTTPEIPRATRPHRLTSRRKCVLGCGIFEW